MADNLIDVRAPGCAGNEFAGYCKCPKCGTSIQLTIQNHTSTGFDAVCSCGQKVRGQLLRRSA